MSFCWILARPLSSEGPESNKQERLKVTSYMSDRTELGSFRSMLCCSVVSKGMMLAKDIRIVSERGGRTEIGVIEGDAEANSPSVMELMVRILGERPSKLPSGTPDEITDREQMSKLTLYQ